MGESRNGAGFGGALRAFHFHVLLGLHKAFNKAGLQLSPAHRAKMLVNLCKEGVDESIFRIFERFGEGKLRFSQEGEDALLDRCLPEGGIGFYVDIGAHHPYRFSNTCGLHRRGWRGINIDATPGSMEPFRIARPRDVNLECAVSDVAKSIVFYLFTEGALNTANPVLASERVRGGAIPNGTKEVKALPLSSILDGHLPPGQKIDVMSIDVEGHELEVLNSNNWDAYSPTFLILEILDTPLEKLPAHPVAVFMAGKGYSPVSVLRQSVFFVKDSPHSPSPFLH